MKYHKFSRFYLALIFVRTITLMLRTGVRAGRTIPLRVVRPTRLRLLPIFRRSLEKCEHRGMLYPYSMFSTIRSFAGEYLRKFSRRELFQRAEPYPSRDAWRRCCRPKRGSDIYQSIGVRPLINCRGTFTIVGGSLILPEVRDAMDAASRRFVHIDEMMKGIGKRLAELTGAEWGIVTSGCAAALAHATAACVAGGNPDLHVRIPNLEGFDKDEVIIPTHSRNVYDSAIRSVGVRIIEVANPEEFENAFGPRTAMVYIFAGPRADNGPFPYRDHHAYREAAKCSRPGGCGG